MFYIDNYATWKGSMAIDTPMYWFIICHGLLIHLLGVTFVLMKEIRLTSWGWGSFSIVFPIIYKGFILPRWCRISFINRTLPRFALDITSHQEQPQAWLGLHLDNASDVLCPDAQKGGGQVGRQPLEADLESISAPWIWISTFHHAANAAASLMVW